MKPVVQAVNLTKYYPLLPKRFTDLRTLKYHIRPNSREGVLALDNVSFSVSRGEVYCILGPNGSGKTTLCKIACGLLYPTSGKLMILGYDSVKEHKRIAREIFVVLSDYVNM